VPATKPAKTVATARRRVLAVARGGTINGVYAALPMTALEQFRADLLLALGETK